MEFEIKMKNEVHDEIHTLMNNIKDLNNGDEIGGWLFGDWTEQDDKYTLLLDKFVIPNQEVTGAEVDISPESMSQVMKEFGPQECNRIKAHWHIHPFGKGNTNWSGIDEEKINAFTNPDKGREIFVFLLSSEDQIKARVEVNIKAQLNIAGEKTVYFKQTHDNLEVSKETTARDSTMFDKLKKLISEKVSRKTYVSTTTGRDDWKDFMGYNKQTKFKRADLFSIQAKGKKITISIRPELDTYLTNHAEVSYELKNPDDRQEKRKVVWYIYNLKNESSVEDVKKMLNNELTLLEQEYQDKIIDMEDELFEGVNYNNQHWMYN